MLKKILNMSPVLIVVCIWIVGDLIASPAGSAFASVPVAPSGCVLTWIPVPGPNPGSGSNVLNDVGIVSANDIWAVGTQDQYGESLALIEHWDGTAWRIVSSPNVSGARNSLVSIAAIATHDVWAVGSTELSNSVLPLLLHWDGNAWSIVEGPPTEFGRLTSISAVSANDVWSVGSGPGGPLMLHWDGETWETVPVLTTVPLVRVLARAANDVWALGHNDSMATIMRWDGTTWKEHSTFAVGIYPGWETYLTDLVVLDSGELWVTGYSRTSYLVTQVHAYSYYWDGTRWSYRDPLHTADNVYLNRMLRVTLDRSVAVGGDSGVTYILNLEGEQWTNYHLDSGDVYGEAKGIAAISENDFWVVGRNGGYPSGTMILHGTLPCRVAPPVPAQVSPADGDILNEVRPTFTWNTTADAEWYQWEIWNDPPGPDAARYESRLTDAQYTPTDHLPDGTYAWRVSACNYAGCSPWSEKWRFQIESLVLDTPPTILEPADGAFLTTLRQELVWTDILAQSYTIQVRRDSPKGTHRTKIQTNRTRYTLELDSGVYSWRVKGCNNGLCSRWSMWHTFTLFRTDTPPPYAIRPRSGQLLPNHTPRFRWARHAVGTRYRLELVRDSIDGPRVKLVEIENKTEWVRKTPLPAGKYYWRLAACFEQVCTPWSEFIGFEITDQPRGPDLLYPQDKQHLAASDLVLDWQDSPGAQSYYVLVRERGTKKQWAVIAETTESKYKPALLPNQRWYTWKVQACHPGLCSLWSRVRSFYLD